MLSSPTEIIKHGRHARRKKPQLYSFAVLKYDSWNQLKTEKKCLLSSMEIKENVLVSSQISKVDCKDALEMICNLESDGDERGAFTLCSAFLTHQLLHADSYCAW